MSLLDFLNANSGAGSVSTPPAQGSVAAPSQGSSLLANLIQQTNASDANKADAYTGQPVVTGGGGNQQTTPDSGTDVTPVTVTANKPPMNYDNTKALTDVNAAVSKDAAAGGATNPYGVLPPSAQHSTLSRVLGVLGDAFLVGGDKQPLYMQGQQRQVMANAMAGYDQNPQAAIQRLIATGEPGSLDTADKLRQTLAQQALQKQIQDQNFQYKSTMIADQKNRIAQSMAGTWGAAASAAKTPADYQNVYNQATARAQALDPSFDASIFGIPHPEDWRPGQQYGATEGQALRNAATTRGQNMTQQNAQTSAQARITAAGVRPAPAQNTSQYDAVLLNKAAQGQALSAPEQERLKKLNATTSHPQLALGTAGGNGGANHTQQFQVGTVYHDAHGNKATFRGYQNGKPVFN